VRKVLIGAVAGAIVLACAAVALATGTQQTFSYKFGAKKPNKATTTSLVLSSKDPTNTAHNNAPDPARKVVLGFPKGSNIDQKAAPQCSATATQLTANPSACKSSTIIGTGTASANSTFASVGEINATVTAYNATSKHLLIYVQPAPGAPAQPFTITATFSGSKRSGFKLTTTPPPNCIPPGTPAQGCPSGEAPLDSFKLNTRNRKSGKHVLFTTPSTCPKSKNWTFTATITFKTDGTKSYTTKSPCTA
jgi:hypothetical protein